MSTVKPEEGVFPHRETDRCLACRGVGYPTRRHDLCPALFCNCTNPQHRKKRAGTGKRRKA